MFTEQAAANPAEKTGVKETSTRTFAQDVLAPSQKNPVLVYFTASWCGPCKQLSPIMDEMASLAEGKLHIFKLDIDKDPAIPGQLGIQSVPAVIAFVKGQPVDGFMGALPKNDILAFMERLVGSLGSTTLEPILDAADKALEANNLVEAAETYAAVLSQDANNVRAIAGLALAQAKSGNSEAAKTTLAILSEKDRASAPVQAVRAKIDLMEQSAHLGDASSFEARISANPDDFEARHDLALLLAAANNKEEALKHLLYIVRKDREWNEDGARKQLVQFFEAWGAADPATLKGRRQLSSLLFA